MENEIFEKIKRKYKKSNKYMLCVSYEDIGILIHIIEVLDKQLKFRKESNIKLTKEQKENAIKYLRNYKDSLNKRAFKEENIYVFEQLIQRISNIIYIIYKLEE